MGFAHRAGLSRISILACISIIISSGFGLGLSQDRDADSKQGGKKKEGLPLKPERKIEFETDEGTWLSLDVSPDGKTVLFELVGDLYTVPIEGGRAQRITEGMAFDAQPSYSPDGKWIAFISDRDGAENLWIAKADGTDPRQLSKGPRNDLLSPSWTADSEYVLVSKSAQRGVSVWMYHREGGTGLEVTKAQEGGGDEGPGPAGRSAAKVRFGASLSPDGRYLYFAQKDQQSVYNQMEFGWEIFRRDMITGDVDQITQAGGGAFRPLLSPDGAQLVYGTRHETRTGLRIRDLHSGTDRWLKYPVQRDDMESRGSRDLLPGYAFLPDGKEIVLTYGGKLHRVNIDTGAEHEIPFQATVSQDLGPLVNFQRRVDEGPVRSRLIQDPVQSPDGSRLAFSAMARLYVMDFADGVPRRVTRQDVDEFKPAWSPDGKTLAFVTWNYNGDGHIWKVAADGSGTPQRLTRTAAFYSDPRYSPDGTRIVAQRGNAWMRSQEPSEFGGLRIPTDLVWIPAEGGETQLIVPARGLGTPHFGPEPDRVYFYSREGLVSMRFDGTDRRTHLKLTGKPRRGNRPGPAQGAQISPDGHRVLAKTSNQLFLLPLPPVGGEPPEVNLFSPAVPTAQITDVGSDSFNWSADGKSVTWSVGATFFRRPLETISFEPSKGKEGDRDGDESEDADKEAKEEGDSAESEPTRKPREEAEGVEAFEVDLEFPRYAPTGTVVLRGATVITMDGDQVIENADVVVTGNRIVGASERGRVPIPAGARQIDVSGKFIVPGFIDSHAHFDVRTEGVFELRNWCFMANLAYGVTTGLDVQTSTNDYLTYQDLIEAGRMIGPRAYSTGPGVFSDTDFQSADDAFFVLEKYKKYYRNNNLKSYVVGNRKQRQWVVEAAKKLELTVTTEGALDLKLDMTHAIDGFGGNEHALPIVPLFKDVVELFARSKTSYTPTLLVLYGGPWAENYYYETTEVHDDAKLNRFTPHNEIDELTKRRPWFRKDEHSFPKTAAQAAKIQRAGGYVGVGGHGQLQGLGYHWEMWSLASGGMTPREVLRAATIDGAHIVGLSQDLGSIQSGKLADLLVLDRDPLADIRNTNSIRMVMKNGELFDGDTLREIWPEQKEIEPFWWWNDTTADAAAEGK